MPELSKEDCDEIIRSPSDSKALVQLLALQLKKTIAERDESTLYADTLRDQIGFFRDRNWIKCSERLPEVGDKVLVRIPVCNYFNIENAEYKGDGRFLCAWFSTRGKGCAYDVTHWQPLPEPPKDGE